MNTKRDCNDKKTPRRGRLLFYQSQTRARRELQALQLRFANRDAVDFVALTNGVDDILPLTHFAEHRVLAVKVRRFNVRDEKLAAVGVGAGVGHRKRADAVSVGIASGFVAKTIAGASRAGSGWVAALNHKVGNDAMKGHAVVKAVAR